MANITGIVTFAAGTPADPAPVNTNFSKIVTAFNTFALQTDTPRTVTAVITFAVAPIFSVPVSFAGLTITSGGATITGDVGITGNTTFTGSTNTTVNAAVGGALSVTGNASVGGTFGAGGLATFGGTATFAGLVTLAGGLSGSIAGASGYDAANLVGTTLPALIGTALTALNATNLGSGTVAAARLPGTMNATTFAGSVTTTDLTASGSVSLGGTATGVLTANGRAVFNNPGASDSQESLQIGSDACISAVAPTGTTSWWRVRLPSGALVKILLQAP